MHESLINRETEGTQSPLRLGRFRGERKRAANRDSGAQVAVGSSLLATETLAAMQPSALPSQNHEQDPALAALASLPAASRAVQRQEEGAHCAMMEWAGIH